MLKLLQLLGAIGICCVFTVSAQTKLGFSFNIVVVDSVLKQPLEYASITIPELHKNYLANKQGLVRIDSLRTGLYTVQCSFVGYHVFQQKIWVDKNMKLQVELCPEYHHLHEAEIIGHSDEMQGMNIQNKTVLDAKRIEQTRGITLSDQLKQLQGVTLLSTGPAITKPVIRGLHSNRLVTVNGNVKQEGQQWAADHGTEIDPFLPEKIEIIKGASAVEYGVEAIGGVVKLSPRAFAKNKGVDAKLQAMGASNNGLFAGSFALDALHGNKHKLNWQTQVTFRQAGDSRTPDYVMSNTGFKEFNQSAALHYEYKNFHATFAQSYFSTQLGILRAAHVGNTTDLMLAIAKGEPSYSAPFTYSIDKPKQEVIHTINSLTLNYTFKKQSAIQLLLSRQLNSRKEFDRPPTWATSQQYDKPAYDLALTTHDAALKFEPKRWHGLKGLFGIAYNNQGNYAQGLQPTIPNFVMHTSSFFAIEKWNKGRWMAEAGARFDVRLQTIYRTEKTEVVQQLKQFSSTSFALGVSYLANQYVKIKTNVATAKRPPSINELYSYGLHGGTASFEIGNNNLIPENSYNIEAGLEINHEKWLVALSAYYNSINNFIYKEPLPVPTITIRGAFPQFKYVQHNVQIRGIELNLTRNFVKYFYATINGAFLSAQNTSQQQPLIFMPANRTSVLLGYQRIKVFKLQHVYANIQHTFVARQYRFPVGVDYVNPPNAYNLFDVNFGFEMHIAKQPIRWSFSVYNLFNQSYRDYLSRFRYYTLDPGRNLMIRMAIPFTIYKSKNN